MNTDVGPVDGDERLAKVVQGRLVTFRDVLLARRHYAAPRRPMAGMPYEARSSPADQKACKNAGMGPEGAEKHA